SWCDLEGEVVDCGGRPVALGETCDRDGRHRLFGATAYRGSDHGVSNDRWHQDCRGTPAGARYLRHLSTGSCPLLVGLIPGKCPVCPPPPPARGRRRTEAPHRRRSTTSDHCSATFRQTCVP